MFHNKQHIFFDLDHTLWDFEKNSALTYQEIFSQLEVNFNLEDFITIYTPTNFKYWKLFREEKINKLDLRYYRLKEVFDALNFSADKEFIHKIADQYIQLLPTYNHLYKGALEVLDYLKPKYNLHIITNGFAEVQANKIKNSGLQTYFDIIVNSEMAEVKKPHPRIFELALSLANASPKQSIMIGDSLEADIEGAQALGMETIYFNEFKNPHKNKTLEVFELIELKNFF